MKWISKNLKDLVYLFISWGWIVLYPSIFDFFIPLISTYINIKTIHFILIKTYICLWNQSLFHIDVVLVIIYTKFWVLWKNKWGPESSLTFVPLSLILFLYSRKQLSPLKNSLNKKTEEEEQQQQQETIMVWIHLLSF